MPKPSLKHVFDSEDAILEYSEMVITGNRRSLWDDLAKAVQKTRSGQNSPNADQYRRWFNRNAPEVMEAQRAHWAHLQSEAAGFAKVVVKPPKQPRAKSSPSKAAVAGAKNKLIQKGQQKQHKGPHLVSVPLEETVGVIIPPKNVVTELASVAFAMPLDLEIITYGLEEEPDNRIQWPSFVDLPDGLWADEEIPDYPMGDSSPSIPDLYDPSSNNPFDHPIEEIWENYDKVLSPESQTSQVISPEVDALIQAAIETYNIPLAPLPPNA